MSDLGKYWASTPAISANSLTHNAESVVSHRIDIAGVASSILATPTIKSRGNSASCRGFFVAEQLLDNDLIGHGRARMPAFCPVRWVSGGPG